LVENEDIDNDRDEEFNDKEDEERGIGI